MQWFYSYNLELRFKNQALVATSLREAGNLLGDCGLVCSEIVKVIRESHESQFETKSALGTRNQGCCLAVTIL